MKTLDVQHCSGCEDNFYNGNNPYGVEKCWMRDKAKLEPRMLIPIHQCPPYLHIKSSMRPNCYKAKGYASVKPEAIGKDGFWAR